MNVSDSNCGDRSILTFVFLYSIGWFIKEHGNYLLNGCNPWVIYGMVMVVFFVMVSFLPSTFSRGVNFLARAYNTIGLTLFSILFFLCFRFIKIQKKWINSIAKSTFAIYLIHGNNIVTYHRWIYNPYTMFGCRINDIHLKLCYLFLTAICICIGCIVIDQIRILFFKYVGVDWTINRVDVIIRNRVVCKFE